MGDKPDPGQTADNPLESDPEYWRLMAPLHDKSRIWENAFNSETEASARGWFGGPLLASASVLEEIAPSLARAMAEAGAWELGVLMPLGFVLLAGHPVAGTLNPRTDPVIRLEEAHNGQRLARLLSDSGIQVADYFGTSFLGTWPSGSGGRVVQLGQVHRNEQGDEYLYWYTTPLAGLGELIEDESLIIAVVSVLPNFLLSACYVAECPMPFQDNVLSLMGGRSSVLFGTGSKPGREVPELVCRLALPHGDNLTNFLAQVDDAGWTRAFWASSRIDVGYAIPLETSDSAVIQAIKVAVDTSLRFAALVENGWILHQTDDYGFQGVLSAQCASVEGGTQMWIPTSRGAELLDLLTPCE